MAVPLLHHCVVYVHWGGCYRHWGGCYRVSEELSSGASLVEASADLFFITGERVSFVVLADSFLRGRIFSSSPGSRAVRE
eukprot:935411-Prorocentrum_minimum.AAC.1